MTDTTTQAIAPPSAALTPDGAASYISAAYGPFLSHDMTKALRADVERMMDAWGDLIMTTTLELTDRR